MEEFGIFLKSQDSRGGIKNLKLEGVKKYMKYVNVYKPIVANIIIEGIIVITIIVVSKFL